MRILFLLFFTFSALGLDQYLAANTFGSIGGSGGSSGDSKSSSRGTTFGAIGSSGKKSSSSGSKSASSGGSFIGPRPTSSGPKIYKYRPNVPTVNLKIPASGHIWYDFSKVIKDHHGRRLELKPYLTNVNRVPGIWEGINIIQYPHTVDGMKMLFTTKYTYGHYYVVYAYHKVDGVEHRSFPAWGRINITRNKRPNISNEGQTLEVSIKDNETFTYQLRASDPDGKSADVVLSSYSSGGFKHSITKDGLFKFTPKPYELGVKNFHFRADDGMDRSYYGRSIKINVTEGHKKPVAKNLTATARENISVAVNLSGTDENGDSLTYRVVKNPEHGRYTLSGRSLRFYPGTNRLDPVTIQYVAVDKYSQSEPATVSINIKDLPNAPTVSVPNSTTYNISKQYTLSKYVNVTNDGWSGGRSMTLEVDNEQLFKDNQEPKLSSDGTLRFFPNEEKLGLATLTVTVKNNGDISEGGANTTKKIFYLNIDTVNKAPVFGATLSNVTTRSIGFQEISDFVDMSKITPGPSYESNQKTHFSYSVTNEELFLDPETGLKHLPQIDSDGGLKFFIPAYVKGTSSVTVNLHDDKGAVTTKKFYIYINTLSEAPTFLLKEDTYQLNNYEQLNVVDFAYNIDGINTEIGQVETSEIVVVSGSQFLEDSITPTFIKNAGGNYDLTVMPKRYVKGSVELEVSISNNADISNGGENTTTRKIFVNINTVNRAPVINLSNSVIYKLDGDRVYPNTKLVTLVSKGKADEDDQTVRYEMEVVNPSFFANPPVLSDNGYLSFTIANDVTYEDATLKIKAIDNGPTINGGSNTSSVKQLVIRYRTLPTANIDIVNLDNDDFCYTNNVLANDTKTPGVEFYVKSWTHGAFGQVTYLSEGVFKYDLTAETTGSDQFSYTLAARGDPNVVFSVSKVVVTRNPVVQETTVEVTEDELAELDLLPYVSDPDGHTFELNSVLIDPSYGTAKVVDGKLQYKPGQDYFGNDFLNYQVLDSSGAEGSGVLNIKVINVNDAPVVPEIVVNIDPNAVASIIEIDVLESATDPDGDELYLDTFTGTQQLYQEFSGNSFFELIDVSGGNLENGFDCFEFTISDGNVSTTSKAYFKLTDVGDIELPTLESSLFKTIYSAGNIAVDEFIGSGNAYRLISQGNMELNNVNFDDQDKIIFSVYQHNTQPDLAYTFDMAENTQLYLGTIFNDIETEGGIKVVHFNGLPSDGIFGGYAGNINYIPFDDFYGYDQFNLTLNNNLDEDRLLKVGVYISGINDPPSFDLQAIPTADEDEFGLVDIYGFITNVYAGEYFQTMTGNVSNFSDESFFATLPHFTGANSLTYQVAEHRYGDVTFDVVLTDDDPDNPLSTIKTVEMSVLPVNDAPIVTNVLIYDLLENESISVNDINGLLSAAYDVEGDTMNVVINAEDKPSQGVFDFLGDGSFDYTPNQYYFGTDTIRYRVSDGDEISDFYDSFLSVAPVNSAPVSVPLSYNLDEDESLTISAAEGLLSQAVDVETDPISIKEITETENGTLNYNADGSFTYTPKENYFGSDIYWMTLKDHEDDSEPICVKFNVFGKNDTPVVTDATYQFLSTGNLVFTSGNGLALNVNDPDGDDLTFALKEDALSGNLMLNEDGSFVYLPAGTWSKSNFFTYVTSDGDKSVEGTVNLEVIDNPTPSVNVIVDEHWAQSFVNLSAVISDLGESGHEDEIEYSWEVLPNPYGLDVNLSSYDTPETIANFNLWVSYDYQFKITATYRDTEISEIITVPYRRDGDEFRIIMSVGKWFNLHNVISGAITNVTLVDETKGLQVSRIGGLFHLKSDVIGNGINQVIVSYSDGTTKVHSFFVDIISLQFPLPFMKEIDIPLSTIQDSWYLQGVLDTDSVELISVSPSHQIGSKRYIKSFNNSESLSFVVDVRDQFSRRHRLSFTENVYFDDANFENPVWQGPAITFESLPNLYFLEDIVLSLDGAETDVRLIENGNFKANEITLTRNLKPVGEQYKHIPSITQTFKTTPYARFYHYRGVDISKYIIDYDISVEMGLSPRLPVGQTHNVPLIQSIKSIMVDKVLIDIESKDKCYAIKENTHLVSQSLPDGSIKEFYRFNEGKLEEFFDITFDSNKYSKNNFFVGHSLTTNDPSDSLVTISISRKDYYHGTASFEHQCDLPSRPELQLSINNGFVIQEGESSYKIPENTNLNISFNHYNGVDGSLEWFVESQSDHTGNSFQGSFNPGVYQGSVEFRHNGQDLVYGFSLTVFEDTDNDLIDDAWELYSFGGLLKAGYADRVEDSDQDNLGKYAEFIFGTDVHNKDSDGDSYHPNDKSILNTTDGFEYYGLAASRFIIPTSYIFEESDPNIFDTDRDGISDGYEAFNGLDSRNKFDASLDKDGDDLSNLEEFLYDTDPNNIDSDGDGVPDGAELLGGGDPSDGSDNGVQPDGTVRASFALGDTSLSESEYYTMTLYEQLLNSLGQVIQETKLFTMPGPNGFTASRFANLKYDTQYRAEIYFEFGKNEGDDIHFSIDADIEVVSGGEALSEPGGGSKNPQLSYPHDVIFKTGSAPVDDPEDPEEPVDGAVSFTPDALTHTNSNAITVFPGDYEYVEANIDITKSEDPFSIWYKIEDSMIAKIDKGNSFVTQTRASQFIEDLKIYGVKNDAVTNLIAYEGVFGDVANSKVVGSIPVKVGGTIELSLSRIPTFSVVDSLPNTKPSLSKPGAFNLDAPLDLKTVSQFRGNQSAEIEFIIKDKDGNVRIGKKLYVKFDDLNNEDNLTISQNFYSADENGKYSATISADSSIQNSPKNIELLSEKLTVLVGESAELANDNQFDFSLLPGFGFNDQKKGVFSGDKFSFKASTHDAYGNEYITHVRLNIPVMNHALHGTIKKWIDGGNSYSYDPLFSPTGLFGTHTINGYNFPLDHNTLPRNVIIAEVYEKLGNADFPDFEPAPEEDRGEFEIEALLVVIGVEVAKALTPGADIIDIVNEFIYKPLFANENPDTIVGVLSMIGLAADLGYLTPLSGVGSAALNVIVGSLRATVKIVSKFTGGAKFLKDLFKYGDSFVTSINLLKTYVDRAYKATGTSSVVDATVKIVTQYQKLVQNIIDTGNSAAVQTIWKLAERAGKHYSDDAALGMSRFINARAGIASKLDEFYDWADNFANGDDVIEATFDLIGLNKANGDKLIDLTKFSDDAVEGLSVFLKGKGDVSFADAKILAGKIIDVGTEHADNIFRSVKNLDEVKASKFFEDANNITDEDLIELTQELRWVESWDKLYDFGSIVRRNVPNIKQRGLIDEHAGTISSASNARKGNFGEIGADLDLNTRGYQSLQPRIDSIDSSGHNGLDGVYRAPNGEFVVVEGKYTGSATLNPANDETGLPRQMSDAWITSRNWSDINLDQNIIDNLLNTNNYQRVLAKVAPDGTVTYKLVNADGYQITGNAGVFNP